MRIAVPKETMKGECRVALVPDAAARLIKSGFEVVVQAGAGVRSVFSDDEYRQVGVTLVEKVTEVYRGADIVLKVQRPLPLVDGKHETDMLEQGAVLIGFLQPLTNPDLTNRLHQIQRFSCCCLYELSTIGFEFSFFPGFHLSFISMGLCNKIKIDQIFPGICQLGKDWTPFAITYGLSFKSSGVHHTEWC